MAETIDEVDEPSRKNRIAAFASALISIHCTKNVVTEENELVEKCLGWVEKKVDDGKFVVSFDNKI